MVCQVHEQVAGLLGHHAPVGVAVTPRTWTRRLASSITNNTCRRLSGTVSTWNRSHATIPSAGRTGTVARSAQAAWRRVAPARLRGSHTVLGASLSPSRTSSPWLRRYPRSGSPPPAAGSGAAAPAGSTVDRAGSGARPVASDQVAMPAQQRPRRHEPMVSALGGSPGPTPTGRRGLASRGVAGRPDGAGPRPRAGVRGVRRSWPPGRGQQCKPVDELTEDQVEQSQRFHGWRSSRISETGAKLQVNATHEILGTHRYAAFSCQGLIYRFRRYLANRSRIR